MLAVVGGKGGTGKTTISLGLARALAGRRHSPIVVDGDQDMPDLAVVCGVPQRPGLADVAEGEDVATVSHPVPRLDGVRVIPATPGDPLEPAVPALRSVDPVIIDCPAGAGPDVALPLRAARAAVIVTRPNRTAIVDAVKTATVARRLDAPVAAVVAVGARSVPGTLQRRLRADVAGSVPWVDGPPLADPEVTAALRRLANDLQGRKTPLWGNVEID